MRDTRKAGTRLIGYVFWIADEKGHPKMKAKDIEVFKFIVARLIVRDEMTIAVEEISCGSEFTNYFHKALRFL